MANDAGFTHPELKHGYQYGPRLMTGPVPVGASEVFSNQGGHFVWFDTSRRIEIAGSGTNPDSGAYIFGWAECGGGITASSTEGATKLVVDVSPYSVYCIPADAAVLATMRGKVCDLVVTSNVQYADVGEANEDYLVICDVDITNQLVYVRMNPAAIYLTNIA